MDHSSDEKAPDPKASKDCEENQPAADHTGIAAHFGIGRGKRVLGA
jgi:hypothetical protein